MRKITEKGFNHKPLTSIHSPWKKGDYKGNKNFAKYHQHKRSLNNDITVDTQSLMGQFLANGGTIIKCPDKTA